MRERLPLPKIVEELLVAFWERPLPELVERDGALLRAPGKADVLIGMRRSGKTFRLFQEMVRLVADGVDRRQVLYVNLEDDRLGQVDLRSLDTILETFYGLSPGARDGGAHLFFDEVQRVEGWARFARRVIDTESAQLYVTGSSAKLLSTEVATEFRGRALAHEVLPFSCRELVRLGGAEPPVRAPGPRERSRLENLVERYLRVGGLPEVQTYDELARTRVLQGYVELVTVRDVAERHGVSNVIVARALALAALGSTGGRFSVNKAYRDFRSRGLEVSKDTLYALVEHFEDAFLFFMVPEFRVSLRARSTRPRKIYAVDPGLASAVSHAAAQDLGARLETAVYLELRRRLTDARDGGISYLVTRSGREVDFVVGDAAAGHVGQLIQVSADMRDPRTRRRELRALDDAMGELGVTESVVVTLRERGEEKLPSGRVRIVPAWRWLLGL